ncbi:MAG: tetratricopeptide repeat protein [Arenicellales bacterium]|nr:tetratricopeptide repeat protein [Arenicellales bacterium]
MTPFAEQGDANAQGYLGLMCQYGEGVPQDYKTALKWYTLSAEQGSALTRLGVFYKNGLGVPQDNLYAYMWLQIAATSGRKKASELRDIVAKEMTPAQIEKAEKLAHECIAKKPKGC